MNQRIVNNNDNLDSEKHRNSIAAFTGFAYNGYKWTQSGASIVIITLFLNICIAVRCILSRREQFKYTPIE